MNPGESGSYQCWVRDSFNDSSPWFKSPAVQVRMIEETLTTVEHISILFCCFLLLTLVAGVCVMASMADRRRDASYLERPRLYGPNVALNGDILEFRCEVPPFPPEDILLQVYKVGDRSNNLAEHTLLNESVAHFSMVVNYATHDGDLECMASVLNNSLIQPTVSHRHYLKIVDPVEGATLAVQSGAVELFEGKKLVLHCNVKSGTDVSYSWLLDNQPLPAIAFHHAHQELHINRTTPKHSGSYSCVATNRFNATKIYTVASPEVVITVKEYVSSPDVSYTVLKTDSQNYSALVTCKSSRGTLPITFSLYNGETPVANETVETQHAAFVVPLSHRSAVLRCQAENGDRIAYSERMALHVGECVFSIRGFGSCYLMLQARHLVPLGGPVTMRYKYSTGEDFSVTSVEIFCRAAQGTHLRFQWFHNSSLLDDTWSFRLSNQESVLLRSVDRRSAGTYHCEVSDLFDNATVIQSEKMYLEKEGIPVALRTLQPVSTLLLQPLQPKCLIIGSNSPLNRLPITVVAVVFSCFALLLISVFSCCCSGVIYSESAARTNMCTYALQLTYAITNSR
ncbi:Fc receptor-like protein 5 [Merluccius polli]|uniref:Fc receptor-like protein 5 n=1 Tax=Merluccius polli TaxID=89951 RepID=A0AA47P140_MERPO|nr:Fc receptor-like protein 5 [Merluccius polli]